MVIFIDESGTHKQIDHATMAVVYVEINNKEKFERELVKIEQELRITSFHWADERWFMREKFITRISDLDFKVKVAVFKNPINPEKIMEIVFNQLITEQNIKKILIDGKKPRWYEQKLKKVLRDKGVSVHKLKTVRNEISEPGIQLADALAGLIRYSYDYPIEKITQSLIQKLKKKDRILGIFLLEPVAMKNPA